VTSVQMPKTFYVGIVLIMNICSAEFVEYNFIYLRNLI